jgi:hypothetical protein
MRPHVDSAQNVRPRVLQAANPRTAAGIRALHAAARVVGSGPVRSAVNLLGRPLVHLAVNDVTLPDHPEPATVG